VQGQAELLQVIQALRACGGLTDLLYGGEQEADQDRDDRDDNAADNLVNVPVDAEDLGLQLGALCLEATGRGA
jgi:hypothetical protein